MILDYIGVKEINGSLIVIDNVENAFYEETVDIRLDDGSMRQGRIVQMDGKRFVIQVFEGSREISLDNTRTRLRGRAMEMPLSPEMLGRVFNGAGDPIDGLGEIYPEQRMNINGAPINPVSRVYPRNYIHTGISSIDTLMTLIRGQKLPIFSGSGMQHNKLAAQIVKQANIAAEEGQEFGIVFAAMGQAFFTLSLGIGALAIFGSYIGKERALLGESVRVVVLDTFVAITAGLIIFPACFTYGVDQTSGPSLIFITLPNIFANMAMGRLWGSLFFLFMAFAALSTVLAVFENIICCDMELMHWDRKKSSWVNLFLIIALSLPCVLGYNLWAWDGFAIFGGAVLDLEDFLVSNLFLPLGSLVYLLFCTSRYGWGWENYKKEVNTGDGLKVHDWMRGYLTYGLPVIVLFIFAFGLYDKFLA